MTVVFSAVSPFLIVMTVDSAVTMEFANSREYTTGRKSYFYPGIGCVAMWGTRAGNKIGPFLSKHLESHQGNYSVDELALLVYQYLVEEYRPRELNVDDMGYHVAGFDSQGRPRLSHIFWGFDRPRPPDQTGPKYEKYDHSPSPQGIEFLYNGRNDLADVIVRTMLAQVAQGKETRFNIGTPVGLARFGDFVARFAAELTPEVGPPFLTYLISPRNEAAQIKNETLCPISEENIVAHLKDLGYAL